MSTVKIAAIDLGTVSSRLLCAEMSNGQITASTKRTVITDLGERVDATGVFAPAAIDRVTQAWHRIRPRGARVRCSPRVLHADERCPRCVQWQ